MWKLLCLLNENDGRVSRSEHARLNFNSVEFQTKIQHKKLLETLNIIRQVAFGIKDMSDNNYIHRDLKPDNIVLNFP